MTAYDYETRNDCRCDRCGRAKDRTHGAMSARLGEWMARGEADRREADERALVKDAQGLSHSEAAALLDKCEAFTVPGSKLGTIDAFLRYTDSDDTCTSGALTVHTGSSQGCNSLMPASFFKVKGYATSVMCRVGQSGTVAFSVQLGSATRSCVSCRPVEAIPHERAKPVGLDEAIAEMTSRRESLCGGDHGYEALLRVQRLEAQVARLVEIEAARQAPRSEVRFRDGDVARLSRAVTHDPYEEGAQ